MAALEIRLSRIRVVPLSDRADASTPTGEVVFAALHAMGEFERSLIAERVRAGSGRAPAKGTPFGRSQKSIDSAEIKSMRAVSSTMSTLWISASRFSAGAGE